MLIDISEEIAKDKEELNKELLKILLYYEDLEETKE
jgi:hypothetical protein